MTKDNKAIDSGFAFELLKKTLDKSDECYSDTTLSVVDRVINAYTVLKAGVQEVVKRTTPNPDDLPTELYNHGK